MQRTVTGTLVAVVLAAVAAVPFSAASTGAIDLRIAYRATPTATPKVLTLGCSPVHGTVPSPAAACRKLRALGDAAFAPTPRGRVCTMIAGGPMTTVVTGDYLGHRIWVRLTQSDGCQIGRWNRVSFLLPT